MWNILCLKTKRSRKIKEEKKKTETQKAVPGLAGCGEQ
jgi:hypothetical protein